MKTRLDATTLALLVVCCASWGLNQTAVKVALAGVGPASQLAIRSAVATLLVLAWCRLRGIRLFERDGTLWPGLLVGAAFGVEFVLLFAGLQFTTASRSAILLYLGPFHVAVGAHLWLGERLDGGRIAGLAVAFAGVVLVFSTGGAAAGPDHLLGDAFSVLASIAWAACTLTIKRTALAAVPAEKTLLYQLAVSALIGLAAALVLGEPAPTLPTPVVGWSLVYQGVWISAVTYVIWFQLVRTHPAGLLSAATFMTPVFGVVGAVLLLGEPASWRLAGAVALVAVGIHLVNRPRRVPPTA